MSPITKPRCKVLIDKKDVTGDILSVTVNHKANSIDSFSAALDNDGNKYAHYFDRLRVIEIFAGGEEVGLEKVFRGFVEMPIPTRTADSAIYSLHGLGTASALAWQIIDPDKASYEAQTIAYMISDIFDNYVESLRKGKIASSATTYDYDPKMKTPLTILQDLCTVGNCYFYVDPYDHFSFGEKSARKPLNGVQLDEYNCARLTLSPDFTQIINHIVFRGGGWRRIIDDFADSSLNPNYWIPYIENDGTVTETGGVIACYGNEFDTDRAFFYFNTQPYTLDTDYDITFEVKISGYTKDEMPFCYFIPNPPVAADQLSMKNTYDSLMYYFGGFRLKLGGGAYVDLEVTFTQDTFYTIRIKRLNTTTTIYIEDAEVWSDTLTHPEHNTLQFGISTHSGLATHDDALYLYFDDMNAEIGMYVSSEDTSSQATYYKRMAYQQDKNFVNKPLAQAFVDEIINTYKDPLWRYEVDMVPMLGLKVNHLVTVDNSFFGVNKPLMIDSIRRVCTPESYTMSICLENSPPSVDSIFGGYRIKFDLLMKDVQL